jgi:predicted enzyme related to lactoylglutathione lyase
MAAWRLRRIQRAFDIDAKHNRVGALGGNMLMPLMEVPNTGRFSIVKDPQGAAFALFQPAARH